MRIYRAYRFQEPEGPHDKDCKNLEVCMKGSLFSENPYPFLKVGTLRDIRGRLL